MRQPIKKREIIKTWGAYDFHDVEDLIEELLRVRRAHPSVVVKLDSDYTHDYGDSERHFNLTAYYERDETATEIAARETMEAEQREARRKHFEALKKEFGGN